MSAERARLLNPMPCSVPVERAPLGYTRSGRAVWPITGAEPGDDDDLDDDTDDDDDDDDGAADGKSSKKKSKAQGADKDDDQDDDDDETPSREEFERMRRRMRRADQRRTEAEQALAEERRKGQEPDEAAAQELQTVTAERDGLRDANKSLRLENAFLLNNTVSWHDPELVMREILKDEDVDIDEDGNVSGMDRALKRLARKKPYLVKQDQGKDDDEDDEDDDEDDDERDARRRTRTERSGGASTGRRKRKDGIDRAKVLSTYPALNRR